MKQPQKSTKRSFLSALGFILILAINVQAQNGGGISGTVTDENDARVFDALVTLSSSNGVHLHTVTSEDGACKFENLRSGSYFIEIKANGFSNFTSEEL